MTVLFGLSLACAPSEVPEPAPATDAAPTEAASAARHFGAPFAVATALPASAVLADPGAHVAAPVRLAGEVTEVCQRMGCWAVVRDDAGHSLRVTMKDHAFGIDKDAAGERCDVEGQLVMRAVDPERLKHFESEGSTHPPEEGKAEAWELVATSVELSSG